MPAPDFSPGEILTAGAMDSIGLWLVKTVTIGAGVSSVPVTNAFSANYDNYKIVFENGTASTTANIAFQLTGITSNYFQSGTYVAYSSSAVTGFNQNGGSSFLTAQATTTGYSWTLDLINPFNTELKYFQVSGLGSATYYQFGGFCNSSASATGFTLTPSGGTITGGTIRVYGYRN
jgi:hypothetical protein